LSRASIDPISDLRSIIALYLLLRSLKPDLFFGYTIKPVIWGILISKLAGVPNRIALITGLGYAFIEDRGLKRFAIRLIASGLYKFSLSFSTTVLFQNKDDCDDFRRMRLLPRFVSTEIVSGSGVDLSRFRLKPLPVGSISFLLIARLLVDKGIREYALAARQIRLKHPNVDFHLVGGLDPNPAGIKESEVRSWHDSGFIIWHGHLDDVRPILSKTSVFVLPSYREGIPRTVLEAMATGRPILTTNAPGCRETVIHGKNGLLFPPRDFQSLSDAMEYMVQLSYSDLRRMALASNRLARERFDVNIVTRRMLCAMNL
jgi:glycosyltransferase involved in cell wall biosynthesis